MKLDQRITRGSDEELVYRIVTQRQPIRLDALASAAGLREADLKQIMQRLRQAGLVRSGGGKPARWVLGRDLRVVEPDTGRIGVPSAVRRTFDEDARRCAEDIYGITGLPIKVVLRELRRLQSANLIVRCGPIDPQREFVIYRARPKDNVVRLFGFEDGTGDRRDDCVHYARCVDEYCTRSSGQAQCPKACAAYRPVSHERRLEEAMVSRRTQWTEVVHG